MKQQLGERSAEELGSAIRQLQAQSILHHRAPSNTPVGSPTAETPPEGEYITMSAVLPNDKDDDTGNLFSTSFGKNLLRKPISSDGFNFMEDTTVLHFDQETDFSTVLEDKNFLTSSPMIKFETRFPELASQNDISFFHVFEEQEEHQMMISTQTTPKPITPPKALKANHLKRANSSKPLEGEQAGHETEKFRSEKQPYHVTKNIESRESSIRSSLRNRKPVKYFNTAQSSPKSKGLQPSRTNDKNDNSYQQINRSTTIRRQARHCISKETSELSKKRKMISPRSKAGCWTCRVRKKKCTEEKPSCLPCERLGLICDGYNMKKPDFMTYPQLQRQKLEEIKHHTMQRKVIGVKKKK